MAWEKLPAIGGLSQAEFSDKLKKAMPKALAACVTGALLWGLWVLLWRNPHWPVVASGALFPVGLLVLLRYGRISLNLPLSAFRVDLWLLFFALVAFRVVLAVAKTGYAAIFGRASPAIVAMPIPLRSEMGQLLLLWAITVTPGTIAILAEKDTVYIHTLHRPSAPQRLGLARLVRLLERIWG